MVFLFLAATLAVIFKCTQGVEEKHVGDAFRYLIILTTISQLSVTGSSSRTLLIKVCFLQIIFTWSRIVYFWFSIKLLGLKC